MEQVFCQSCGMPMDTPQAQYGTEANGEPSREYCSYCYENGAFTSEMTMEQMIELCAGIMAGEQDETARRQAKESMRQYFPQLKRWKA